MIRPSESILKLGIEIPNVKALAVYTPAVLTGGLVYVSGQLPMENGQVKFTGRVGEELTVEQGGEAARLCFINALGALLVSGKNVDEVVRVVRLAGYVNCGPGFTQHPEVINAASELSIAIFSDSGIHARAAIGVSSLPRNAAVELEALFQVTV